MQRLRSGYTSIKIWLAVQVTGVTGTMECAFFFSVLAIFGFPGMQATLYQYVQWFSTTFLQLVMLPILSAGQKVTQTQQDAHHRELQHMHESHRAEIARLHDKLDRLAPAPPSALSNPGPCVRLRDARGRFIKKENAAPQEAA